MSSFYGGRPGQSFAIVATFNTLNDMITQFKKGSEYTLVHYDESVLINTGTEKGNVYRRGYNYTNSMGGAELVGNIIGGGSSSLELTDIRIGYDGTIYTTAGEAVRTQIENLKSSQGNFIIFTSIENENNEEEYQVKFQKINGKPTLVYSLKEEEQ